MRRETASREYAALPRWAKQMVRGLRDNSGYGIGGADDLMKQLITDPSKRRDLYSFHAFIKRGEPDSWFRGFCRLADIARALETDTPRTQPKPRTAKNKEL